MPPDGSNPIVGIESSSVSEVTSWLKLGPECYAGCVLCQAIFSLPISFMETP